MNGRTSSEIARHAKRGWDLIAEEYYSPVHATTRNFDRVIAAHLPAFLRGIAAMGPILEIGGGAGKLQDFLPSAGHRLVVGDLSKAMLTAEHRQPKGGITYAQISAFSCPFKDASFAAVVCVLGDSFSTPEAFAEFYRVLIPGGQFVLAVPSKGWGHALRGATGMPLDETCLPTRRYGNVRVPSLLYSERELAMLLSRVGFTVARVASFTASGVISRASEFSEHILLAARVLGIRPEEMPLVTMALASKHPDGACHG